MGRWMDALTGRGGEENVEQLREKLRAFRDLVEKNDRVLELIAEAGEMLGGEYVFDSKYLEDLVRELKGAVHDVVGNLNTITRNRYPVLFETVSAIDARVEADLECRVVVPDAPHIMALEDVGTEHADVVGEKLARLGELRSRLGCRIPAGFVVTTRACREFLDEIGVREAAEVLRLHVMEGAVGVDAEARALQERVLRARLPRSLSRTIRREAARLQADHGPLLLAVRSSAAGEDGEISFAGQYETVLGVEPDDVCDAYQRVVASLFSPGVMEYHKRHGVPPGCGLMAVGCLAMVPARASGVVYSLDPMTGDNVQLVSAAWGLGKAVVEGEAADRLEVERTPGYPVRSRRIADKEWRYVTLPERGLVREPVPDAEREAPALGDEQAAELAETACRVERYMKAAQDIEWAVDDDGRLFILQARPLEVAAPPAPVDGDLPEVVARYPVLLRDCGQVACRGIGSGKVHRVTSLDVAPEAVPPGAVLVTRTATPRLGALLGRASAVVTDVGSATGHFAAVAREFRVPTIVATGVATATLEDGAEVTVDAEEGVVYEGRVEELIRYQLLKRLPFEDAPAFRTLRRVLRRIAPLTLNDPQDSGFDAARCRTYHDVIRFAHEKAVAELTEIGWVKPSRDRRYVRRLELPIPLDLILIDLGDGFRIDPERPTATLRDVTCRPLLPMLETLSTGDAWETAPAEMDLDGFMSSATRSMPLTGALATQPEQNLAIVSRQYVHLSLRLGYHFNIVDAYLTDTPADNYIYFRFAGGVTELTRRSRRAALLKRVLEEQGFVTEGRGDLVIGRLKGIPAELMLDRLAAVGRLIGFTRQLDIYLKNDRLVDDYVERFMSRKPLTSTLDNSGRETEARMNSAPDVLVLDDEPMVGERLKDHLEKNGYAVEVFTESQQAIDRLAKKRFDVVITDLKMEGPNGLDVLQFVRGGRYGTQVIIITGYGSMESAREAEYRGVFEFVNKPFSLDAIEAVTKKAVRKSRKLKDREGT
jgi:pyruvate, water dikinase